MELEVLSAAFVIILTAMYAKRKTSNEKRVVWSKNSYIIYDLRY